MPQPDPRQCCRCAHWTPQDRQRTYSAWCTVCERRVTFDDTCRAWQPAPVVWPSMPPKQPQPEQKP